MPGPLADQTCVVGVGETPHMRPSGRTTFSMACEAIKNAVLDAGLDLKDVDGMTSYNANDSTPSAAIATALGMQLNYGLDIQGGGSSPEALVAHSVGLLVGGYCNVMVVFRSMNGRSNVRMGGQAPTGPRAAPAAGQGSWGMLVGQTTPAQSFGSSCMRHMRDFGTTSRQLGAIAVTHRKHASLNPKAQHKQRITIEDHQNSRWVSKPFHLLDCCQETDVACALVMTRSERAYDLRHPPVFVKGGTARTLITGEGSQLSRPIVHRVAGRYGRNRVFGMSGVTHRDVDITSCYDAFTFTTLIQLEAYGFAQEGEGGPYVESGIIDIDGRYPSNLSGGHLSEGYTHGIQMVVENVRQLRGRADDYCPDWIHGRHSFDRDRGCRQSKKWEDRAPGVTNPSFPEIALCMGWGSENTSSSLVLGRK